MDKDSIKSRVKRETMMMLILGIGAWIVLLIFLSCKSLTGGEKDTYELLKDSEVKLKVHGDGCCMVIYGSLHQLMILNTLFLLWIMKQLEVHHRFHFLLVQNILKPLIIFL